MSSPVSSRLDSALRERRDFNTQTTFIGREMKDASVGRGTSVERLGLSKNIQTSFVEPIPVPQATLPIAILERPSLEDSAVTPKRVTLQVEACDPSEDANRSSRRRTA